MAAPTHLGENETGLLVEQRPHLEKRFALLVLHGMWMEIHQSVTLGSLKPGAVGADSTENVGLSHARGAMRHLLQLTQAADRHFRFRVFCFRTRSWEVQAFAFPFVPRRFRPRRINSATLLVEPFNRCAIA